MVLKRKGYIMAVKRDYDFYKNLPEDKYEEELIRWYYRHNSEEVSLFEPKTFNDKIQWSKLYDKDPRRTEYADKYAVREYVKETIGEEYLVDLIGVYDSFDEIDFDKFPDKFVLKGTHGCKYNIIVNDKSKFDVKDAREKFELWLSKNFAYRPAMELHYKDIKPRIVAEAYLENDNEELYDYKVWCFEGKAHYIEFINNRKHGMHVGFYDTEWNKLEFVSNIKYTNDDIVPKPDNLDELLELSEKLAKDFPHVRVDFYRLNDGRYIFGELTFTTAEGASKWSPRKYNDILGSLFEVDREIIHNKVSSPKVTVIITAHNVDKYIKECVDSVVNQAFNDIEVICINDCSTDGTTEILNSYLDDPRVAIINMKHSMGPSVARNAGMKIAKGEYVMFVDGDDYIVENSIELLYKKATENNLEVLLFDSVNFYDNKKVEEEFKNKFKPHSRTVALDNVVSGNTVIQQLMKAGEYRAVVWLKFVKHSYLESLNIEFIPGIIHEDEAFTPMLVAPADRVMCMKDRLYMHRFREKSIMTSKLSAKNFDGYFIAHHYLMARYISGGYKDIGLFLRAKAMYNSAVLRYKKLSKEDKKNILITAPEVYRYLFENTFIQAMDLHKELAESAYKEELDEIKNSRSYKIGQMIAFIPRKMRGGIRCYKENGLKYTVKLLFKKIKNKLK